MDHVAMTFVCGICCLQEFIEGVKLTNKAAMQEAGLSITDFVDV